MNDNIFKYTCEQCNFSCKFKSLWEKHISTELHKTGKRKQRTDIKEPYKCKDCNYQTKNIVTFKKHKLNAHSNKEAREKEFKYYCKICDLGTFSKGIYQKHIDCKKHKLAIQRNKN